MSGNGFASIVSASFLLGVLFTTIVWDSSLLFGKQILTEGTVSAVEHYYLTWWNAEMTVKVILHVVVSILFMSLVGKFARKSETAYYFSGASLLLMILVASVYIVITIPSIRLIAQDPLDKSILASSIPDTFTRLQAYFAKSNTGPLGDRARNAAAALRNAEPMAWDKRVEHNSVLCAGNTIIAALLVGVVVLQISEWYVEEQLAKENAELAAQGLAPVVAVEAVAVTEEKKTQ
ncbi:BZ3500_MvSof-1268-A1-R1_Chr1-3g01936 [Microbotryum saponariae]|uniref:BZ3500_MvSof-1268-A1-R1_Chr1-3g01936 protein n=1 Tax=Microbotryum saponariae TaxID=289078 RepID=A0A2X0MG14_9BASI|nr:BZ3500_MvSof-1268-A1-R1_Chr1-3g01936 [Microbotryum saponariae]SCZ94950.1 BZ3501_MvSof-1269-A2-R1_Chr1-3g01538 [Microbotryum saponariae]